MAVNAFTEEAPAIAESPLDLRAFPTMSRAARRNDVIAMAV
jgi:hypothetical protein